MASKCNVSDMCGIYRYISFVENSSLQGDIFGSKCVPTNEMFQLFFVFDIFKTGGTTILL